MATTLIYKQTHFGVVVTRLRIKIIRQQISNLNGQEILAIEVSFFLVSVTKSYLLAMYCYTTILWILMVSFFTDYTII